MSTSTEIDRVIKGFYCIWGYSCAVCTFRECPFVGGQAVTVIYNMAIGRQ